MDHGIGWIREGREEKKKYRGKNNYRRRQAGTETGCVWQQRLCLPFFLFLDNITKTPAAAASKRRTTAMHGVRMCTTTSKLQKEKGFCSHTCPQKQSREEPAGSRRRERLWVMGLTAGRKGSRPGGCAGRLQAGDRAKQTGNCRSK